MSVAEISIYLPHVASKVPSELGFHIAARAWSTSPALVQAVAARFPSAVVDSPADKPAVAFNEQSQYAPQSQPPSSDVPVTFQPVVALHGWLDNAASWDIMMPSLLRQFSGTMDCLVIAIDIPGHGWSSHRPQMTGYTPHSYVRDVVHLVDSLGWKNFGILGHSMGAAIGTLVAATQPNRVDFLACIENLGPISIATADVTKSLHVYIDQCKGLARKKMPAYRTIDEAVEARIKGTSNGTLSREGAVCLVKRGICPVMPSAFSVQDAKFTWTWRTDQALVLMPGMSYAEEQVLQFLSSIKCPVTLIIGAKGYKIIPKGRGLEGKRDFDWIDWPKRFATVKNIELAEFPGGHHLHMDAQGAVAQGLPEFIAQFMRTSLAKKPAKL